MNLTEAYEQIWKGKLIGMETPDKQHISRVNWTVELFPKLPPKSLLIDLGCGSGQMLAEAKRRKWNAVGYDIDQSIVNWMNSLGYDCNHKDLSTGINLDLAEADIVTCLDVIEHLIDPKYAMASAFEALKPSGTIYVGTPNCSCWRRVIQLAKGDFPRTSGDDVLKDGGHVGFYGPGDLKGILKDTGFSDIRMHYYNSDPMPVEYLKAFDTIGPLNIWHDFTYMIASAVKP